MSWIRKLFGLDYPDPVVGQVWRSRFNGEDMRVCRVHLDNMGWTHVTVQYWYPDSDWGPHWGLGDYYATGLTQWRRRLRSQRRELVDLILLDGERP